MDLLDQTLITFSSAASKDVWTMRHAVEGVQIFGGIGSGKTSGSGRTLALKYLVAGFGGLVLTVKADEKTAWQEYCHLTGRSDDLIVLEDGGTHRFNFLAYEANQAVGQQGTTENLVEVLKTVIRASQEKAAGRSNDAFWENALDLLMFNVIDLCQLAYGTVSVERMYEVVQASPKTKQDAQADAKAKAQNAFFRAFDRAHAGVMTEIEAWEKTAPPDERERMQDPSYLDEHIGAYVPSYRLLKFLDRFFLETQVALHEKTRSIIDFMFLGFLFRLLREPVYSLFCHGESTVTPHDSMQGKIILLSLPVKVYHKVGRDCQILFKYIWQRAMEKRPVTPDTLPVFLWADEAQNFLHEHDADYQATARSSRIATVYISQNLPNYYACMGGEMGQHRVKSFLGTLATKIFHANADTETNQYASVLIGDDFFEEQSEGTSTGGSTNLIGGTDGEKGQGGDTYTRSYNTSRKLERVVRPEGFIGLKTGRERNEFVVEGYLHRQGDQIRNNLNYSKIKFDQHYRP